ncbi:MAG: methylmalonyl-CoA mutase small subunit, partial [Bacteroidales bacterium]|nr:methylmalonyl-CoA mutase small subunit [Bacteroidales bacterium]
MSEQKLFTDFPPITTKQWEEKIKQDLKGADYEKKLITKTLDGIRIKPYYRSEDLTNLEYLQHLPGNFPFVRSAKTEDNYFDIRQNIFVENFSDTNIKTKDAGAKGANSIGFFICHKENITENEFNTLISGINPENTVLNFISGKITPLILKFFINHIENKGFNPEKIKATFSFDPFGHKTITGNCYNKTNISKDFEVLKEISEIVSEKYPQIKFVNINGIFFANAGATVVQELAFALASANETLAEAEKAGLNPETLIPKMMFTFGVGSNYFIEIAKIRAARLLWAEIAKTWSPEAKDKAAMFINSVTSDVNKTAYDAYVNQLRTTTEAMSAVIGGTDCLTVNPFDITYKKPDNFSERIARNIGIILKEEAHFDKSIDPAAGSYYIENLTNDIAENVWNLFLKIEELGGYHNALKQNFIQDKIKE